MGGTLGTTDLGHRGVEEVVDRRSRGHRPTLLGTTDGASHPSPAAARPRRSVQPKAPNVTPVAVLGATVRWAGAEPGRNHRGAARDRTGPHRHALDPSRVAPGGDPPRRDARR